MVRLYTDSHTKQAYILCISKKKKKKTSGANAFHLFDFDKRKANEMNVFEKKKKKKRPEEYEKEEQRKIIPTAYVC